MTDTSGLPDRSFLFKDHYFVVSGGEIPSSKAPKEGWAKWTGTAGSYAGGRSAPADGGGGGKPYYLSDPAAFGPRGRGRGDGRGYLAEAEQVRPPRTGAGVLKAGRMEREAASKAVHAAMMPRAR